MKIKALYCSFLLSGCLAFAPVAAEEGADSVIVQQAKKEKKEIYLLVSFVQFSR